MSTTASRPYSGWLMQAPVISTKHLKQETIEKLSGRMAGEPNEYDLFAVDTRDGVMVFASDGTEIEGLPDDLRACLDWNIEQGYEWLRFDADGDDIESLPSYDW